MKRNRKYKADRSLLQNTHGSAKSPFNKRKYKPGMHKSINLANSFYGNLLIQRQRIKAFFKNMRGRQLRNLIEKSLKTKNYKAEIIKGLESRLDSLLFRSGIVISFGAARQLVNHGKVFVNGLKITSCSFNIKEDSTITFHASAVKLLEDFLKRCSRKAPNYIAFNAQTMELKIFANKLPKAEKDLFLSTPVNIDNVIRSYRL